jgi:hypothetical protein
MSVWHCLHLNETLTVMVLSDRNRLLVCLREPHSESRHPIEFHRWTLKEAMKAGDRLVQMYYPHDCSKSGCGRWHRVS